LGFPLVRRRKILKKLLPKEGSIRFSEVIEGQGTEFFLAARERGLEGIMAKRKESRYRQGAGRKAGSKSRPECSKKP
jgi:bifunctional non-homologous end joining protein LigD